MVLGWVWCRSTQILVSKHESVNELVELFGDKGILRCRFWYELFCFHVMLKIRKTQSVYQISDYVPINDLMKPFPGRNPATGVWISTTTAHAIMNHAENTKQFLNHNISFTPSLVGIWTLLIGTILNNRWRVLE